ncbi:ABC transporter permease [Myroides injenensis]|uniref:ABC transporter permease n=1 Tax=Myroides injenensis TaxID=1183151 RepID=UPI000289E62D|nr:ABC transporter permease [Myroides injenensis]
MLKNWLKIYWYNAMKHKVYFLLTIVGLAIGMSSFIIMALYYQEEKAYDNWNEYKDRIFIIETKITPTDSWPMLSLPYGAALKNLTPEVEEYMYMGSNYRKGIMVWEGKKILYEKAIAAQSNFFNFFPFEIIKGDKQNPFSGPNQIVVKDSFATLIFTDKNPLNQTVTIDDKDYTIVGIYSNNGVSSSVDSNMIFNTLDESEKTAIKYENWGDFGEALWVKLRDKNDKDVIIRNLKTVYNENVIKRIAKNAGQTSEEFIKDNSIFPLEFYLHELESLRLIKNVDINGTPEGAANAMRIYIALVLSLLILLLAIFNYINITTVQVMNRGKEIGMRKTLGGGYSLFLCQIYLETILTVLISLLLTFGLIEFFLPTLRVFFNASLSFRLFYYLPQVLFFVIIVVVLGGTIPTLYVLSFKTLEMLKGNLKKSKRGIWFKNALLITQFVIACFFIIGSVIVNEQVKYMLNKDLGFKSNQIIALPFEYKSTKNGNSDIYELLQRELGKVKGVEDVSTWSLRMGGGSYASSSYLYNGNTIQAGVAAMDYNFLDVFEIPIKEGRALTKNLASDSITNVLLSEKALSLMQENEPIGKEFDWNNKRFTIVGVVKDFNVFGLQEDYKPLIYLSLNTVPWVKNNIGELYIKINTKNISETIEAIEKVWKEHKISDYPFSYEFIDKRFENTYNKTIQERNMFMVLNLIVVFTALFGLYALASFSISSKLKEVAIRKVLGASIPSIMKQLSLEYIIYCLIGFIIALFPSYYLLNSWLSDYAFRIQIGVFPFILCFLLILVLTLTIVLYKSYMATKVDVLKYIKHE